MPIKTYHDVFVEQLIGRERPGGEFLFKCASVLAGLVEFFVLRALFKNSGVQSSLKGIYK